MSVKNKLTDLNDHLFAQLERLSDDDATGEKLIEEIERSKGVGFIARTIIDNARLVLDARKAIEEHLVADLPDMMGFNKQIVHENGKKK